MKKSIVLSLIIPVMLLTGSFFAPSYAQTTTNDKPTFYHLVPGTYVHDWPRFTMTYPKDWVEVRPAPFESFRAAAPGPAHEPAFGVALIPSVWPGPPLPLDKYADFILPYLRETATDVTVVSDKPSTLRDGTPAREVELKMVMNTVPLTMVRLGTKKGDLWVDTSVSSSSGKVGEDLKAIAYSLEFQPGFDDPVKVPPDVQEFLDKFRNAVMAHDLAKVMSFHSDSILDSGWTKGGIEGLWKSLLPLVTSFEIGVTDFVAEGDKAYLAGFFNHNLGTGKWKCPLKGSPIIKENGEWKWYGNQRDPPP